MYDFGYFVILTPLSFNSERLLKGAEKDRESQNFYL